RCHQLQPHGSLASAPSRLALMLARLFRRSEDNAPRLLSWRAIAAWFLVNEVASALVLVLPLLVSRFEGPANQPVVTTLQSIPQWLWVAAWASLTATAQAVFFRLTLPSVQPIKWILLTLLGVVLAVPSGLTIGVCIVLS